MIGYRIYHLINLVKEKDSLDPQHPLFRQREQAISAQIQLTCAEIDQTLAEMIHQAKMR